MVEHQICKDGMHRAAVQTAGIQITNCSQISLDKFVKRQPHPASTMGSLRSNKRLRKPDWRDAHSRQYVWGYMLSLLLALWEDPGHPALIPKGSGTTPGAQPGRPVATLLW